MRQVRWRRGLPAGDISDVAAGAAAAAGNTNGNGADADTSKAGASTGLVAGAVCGGALVVGLAMLVVVRRRAWARLASPQSTPKAMADLDGASHSRSIAQLQHPGGGGAVTMV